jgi:DNA modification methylase
VEIFEQNGHKLVNADLFLGLELVQNSSIDLIFIDLPYNIGKNGRING